MAQSETPKVSVMNKGAARYAVLLDCLAKQYPEMLSLAEIARQTDLPKATAFRLLKALQEVGYVAYDGYAEAYLFGARMMDLGVKALGQNFGVIAFPSLRRLARETGDTAFSVIAENDHMQCLQRVLGSYPLRTLSLEEGDIWPLGLGAIGMALLAANADAYVDAYLKRYLPLINRYAKLSEADVIARVQHTRDCGYALSRGELLDGMSAVGVAVHYPGVARPIGAISVAAITSRLEGERLPMVVGLLKQEAALMSGSIQTQNALASRMQNNAD